MNSLLAENRRSFHDYTILETFVAGLVLTGQEVKATKNHQISLKGSFITFSNNEAYLTNTHISPYKNAQEIPSYQPDRPRKLLLKRKEIANLLGKKHAQGLTIIPLKVFVAKRGLIKVEIALARGKKMYDKRSDIKKRDSERKIQRAFSSLS